MARLVLSFLGPFHVELDGRPVADFESNKVRALLAYLAVEADRAHARDSLAALLWPGYPDRSALANLRSALANLRGAIGDREARPPFLLITRDTAQFNSASDHALDTAALRHAAAGAVNEAEAPKAIYPGDFLDGFSLPDSPPFEEWLILRREQFRRQAMDVLGRLALLHEARGDYAAAITCAHRQLELEAWDEAAHRRLMILLALSGRRDLALAQYQTCRWQLRHELGVEPARETEALYEQIRDETYSLAAGPVVPEPPAPGAPPYKGLSFFDETDTGLFFGREALTGQLVAHAGDCLAAADGDSRVLTVIGASGSGKSSIVRAGLVPGLRRLALPDPARAGQTRAFGALFVMTPTACPLESLAACLARGGSPAVPSTKLADDLAADPRSLHRAAGRLAAEAGASHLLLVVDQFEELFSLCRDEGSRRAFIDNLLLAAETPGPLVLVIALRADFYDQCAPYEALRRALTDRQLYIGAMSAEELRRAIEQPAEQGNWRFEPGLVDLLLREVGGAPGALPLLSHALLETWHRREGRTMTLAGYQASGGVAGALTRTAESAYRQFTRRERAIARNIFLRLTEVDPSAPDERLPELYTRRRAALAELVARPEEAAQTQAVINRLADARLITIDEETAEVAHEALIREWPRLADWLSENREGLRLRRHLTQAAQEWDRAAHDASLLYRGARLAQVDEWAAAHADDLNALERAFLAASLADEAAQQQRELRAAQELAGAESRRAEAELRRAEEQMQAAATLRRRAISLAFAFGAVAILLLLALWLGQAANRNAQAREAQAEVATSRELAAAAVSSLSADPERSVLLALAGLETAETLEAGNALHQVLPELHVRRIIPAHSQLGASGVAYTPDGARLASIGPDGAARIWDVATGRLVRELVGEPGLYGITVDYSPDGRLLATLWANKIVVWDVETGAVVHQWAGETRGDVDRVDFSTDGRLLAVANLDGLPTVFDLAGGEAAFTLPGHATTTEAIAFSPDGTQVATGDNDGQVMVWDVASRQAVATLAHQGKIHAVAFSPEGRRLATAGEDGALTVWDIPGQRPLLRLPTRSGLYDVEFLPDGERVVGTHQEGATTVWDTASGQLLLNLVGHGSTVISVATAPDNRHIATGGYDGTVRIWDTAPGHELLTVAAHDGPANGLVASLDGRRLVSVGGDGRARVWDTESGVLASSPALDESARFTSVALSPMGDALALGNSDGTISVVELATGTALATLDGHENEVWGLAFSPDGRRVGSASWDGTSRVWDLATGRQVSMLDAPCWAVKVAFSSDGRHLFTTCGLVPYEPEGDGEPAQVVAYQWAADTGQVVRAFPGATTEAYGLAVSPDDRWLALGYSDGLVSVWDVATGEKVRDLTGHAGIAFGMAFNADGTRLATSAFDKLAKVWDVQTGQELATLYGNGSNVFGVTFVSGTQHLATAGGDGTLRVFTLDTVELQELARSRLTRELTAQECRRYLHLEQCPSVQDGAEGAP